MLAGTVVRRLGLMQCGLQVIVPAQWRGGRAWLGLQWWRLVFHIKSAGAGADYVSNLPSGQ
jgi:hypothetical protein